MIWVEGEISNVSQPSSGHCYFTLKDENAQIRCAMFRSKNRRVNFKLENGTHVLIRASLSLYVVRGDYQLIVDYMEETGDGLLRRRFEELKKKLDEEGLFAAETKRAIPEFPKAIGIVTSASGAALRDILTVLNRRFANIPVVIYPTSVQGAKAANDIVAALKIANQRNECDVLIIARGGGSLEDLWPFNEEKVARAVYASSIPTVSGVGHEIDFTIVDFVADVRAPTPSAAAEICTADKQDLTIQLYQQRNVLMRLIKNILENYHHQLHQFQLALIHPAQQLQQAAQQLDYLEQRLKSFMKHQLHNSSQELKYLVAKLNTVSPLATLERGYAIITKHDSKNVVSNAKGLRVGDKVDAKLAKNSLICIIDEITE